MIINFTIMIMFAENFARRLQYLTHKATLHPDLRDGYLSKSQIAAQKYDIITDEEKVKGHLGQLDALFEDMEKLLAAVHSGEETDCLTIDVNCEVRTVLRTVKISEFLKQDQ